MIVEFDRRCQNEETQDQLLFTSYFQQRKKISNVSTNYKNDTYMANSVRVSGKRQFKAPLMMMGDTLEVQFASSATAKNNLTSLSQWGYKVYVRPLYGPPELEVFDLRIGLSGLLAETTFKEMVLLFVRNAKWNTYALMMESAGLLKGIPVKASEFEMKK